MVTQKEKIEGSVTQLAEPLTESLGLELVQVQYQHESMGWTLRILVDRTGGVTVDDCASVSRELSDLLDVEDLIPNAYHLEVSSPGLDRPLVKPEDYSRFVGREITLRTRQAIDGRRNFRGLLAGLDSNTILLQVDGRSFEVQFNQVEKANLVPVLDAPDTVGSQT
jgi:ribosome maturation factor RimP